MLIFDQRYYISRTGKVKDGSNDLAGSENIGTWFKPD